MDIASFNALVTRLRPRLVSAASRWQLRSSTRGYETADDIVQDTMIRLWAIRDRLESYNSVEALAMVVARNIAIDHLRRDGQQPTDPLAEGFEPIDNLVSPDVMADLSVSEHLASQLLSRLPDRQALVVKMRHSDGLELDEIASITGMTEVNVRTILSRGRKRLRELYLSTTTVKYENE